MFVEIGVEMNRFYTPGRLASWAGICPGNEVSRTQVRASQYYRIAARRGARKALVAVAHSILVIATCLLGRKEVYHDLGRNTFDLRGEPGLAQENGG